MLYLKPFFDKIYYKVNCMKTIITTLFCISTFTTFCQETGRMETDRPDQTESPYITRSRNIQAELGFNLERSGTLTTFVHPTALWKYGLNKNFEFRLITQCNSEEVPGALLEKNKMETGLIPIEVGGKLRLWEEKGLLPKTSVVAHVGIPKFASPYYQISKYTPRFRFTMQNTITDNIGLGYNLGTEWRKEADAPFWIYTIGPGFNLGKRGYFYVELFGEFQKNLPPSHNFDSGFGYYLSDNAKMDISSGFNLKNTSEFYIAAGFSFRFKTF